MNSDAVITENLTAVRSSSLNTQPVLAPWVKVVSIPNKICFTTIREQLQQAEFCVCPGVTEINKTILFSLRNSQTSGGLRKKIASVVTPHGHHQRALGQHREEEALNSPWQSQGRLHGGGGQRGSWRMTGRVF